MDIALRLSPLADPSWDHSTYEKFACKREVQWYDGSGRQTEVLSKQPRLAYSFGGRRKWILHGADVVHGRMYLTPNGVNIPDRVDRSRDNSFYLKGVEWLITNKQDWPMDNVEIIVTYQFALVLIEDEIFQ